MRILISNDDGVNARGLEVLERIAGALSDDVWVVAPETEQSGAGHSLTLHRPLRVRHIAERRFAVDGTPTDCVMLAINSLITGAKPTLVLAGVNRGSNVADDVTYSGTIAAAIEATMLGVPAVALSQHYTDDHPVKWATAEGLAPGLIRRLIDAKWPADVLINVNFPDVAADAVEGVAVSRQGRHRFNNLLTERLDPRGRPYYWIGSAYGEWKDAPGSDVVAVHGGAISVTPLSLDMTHEPTSAALRDALK
jgi:5'-nucleotidase